MIKKWFRHWISLWGCHNKIPQTRGLNNRNLVIFPEAKNPRLRYWQHWFLLRPLLVITHSVNVCVLISAYKDTSHHLISRSFLLRSKLAQGPVFQPVLAFNMLSSLIISSFWFKVRGMWLFLSLECLEATRVIKWPNFSIVCQEIGRPMERDRDRGKPSWWSS